MQTREQFKDIEEIRKTLYYAMEKGVKGSFFSTHPDIYNITNMIRSDELLRNHFNFYINVPYIVKYISMLNTMGPVDTIKTVMTGKSTGNNINFFALCAKNIVTMDYLSLANRLVDAEIAPFHGLKVKSILLHNSLCDLAMAYGLTNVIKSFDNHVRKKIGVIPGYGTLNYPAFSKFLDDAGLSESLVMTAVNRLGFYMNPGVGEYEKKFESDKNCILAMATLASGRLKPEDAYKYLNSIGIRHIVVGVSSKEHADETFKMIAEYIT